jgi:hypothetical protein
MIRIILAIIGCVLATSALSEDNRTPIEAYHADSQFYLLICGMKFTAWQMQMELGKTPNEDGNFSGCIKEGKEKTKESFKLAIDSIEKSEAKEALKDYHVAIIAAISGIMPGINETKIKYEERQRELENRTIEAWTRFEIEQ